MTADLLENTFTRHTIEVLESLSNKTSETLKWFLETQTKQNVLAKTADPVLKQLDLEKRSREIEDVLEKLGKKKRKRVKATTSSSSASSQETASASSTSTSEQESATPDHKDEL